MSSRIGFKPRYDLLVTTLAAPPAFLPSFHGRRQGGTLPDSRAVMIWSVMAWRMSFWLGMTDSGGSWLVGNSRPTCRCQLKNEGGSLRLARLETWKSHNVCETIGIDGDLTNI